MDRLTDKTGAQIALPPVGTGETKAFCGQFDGNKSTISNLLISVFAKDVDSDRADTATYEFGSDIGMFGRIKSPENSGAATTRVADFNISGITVQIKTFAGDETPVAGLVAGRADTGVVFERVGVIDGKITAEAGNNVSSEFALVGKFGSGPGSGSEGGNDLTVDPNIETNGFVGLDGTVYGDTLSQNAIAKVSDAKNGHAYYSNQGVLNFLKGTDTSGGELPWNHPVYKKTYLDLSNNLYTLENNSSSAKSFVKKFPNGNSGLNAEDAKLYTLLEEALVSKYGAVSP